MSSHGKYVQAEIDGTANANAKYRGSLETFKVEDFGQQLALGLQKHWLDRGFRKFSHIFAKSIT